MAGTSPRPAMRSTTARPSANWRSRLAVMSALYGCPAAQEQGPKTLIGSPVLLGGEPLEGLYRHHAGEHGPEDFYRRLGFHPTGEYNEGETVAECVLRCRTG